MKILSMVALVFSIAIAAFAADKIEPLDVKAGLWDVTFTSNMSGAPPIPAERLEKMTPEQRERLEKMVKDREAKGAQTSNRKHCVTQEQLKDHAFIEDEPSCKRTVLASTSKELNVRVQCSTEDGTRTSTYHIQAVSSGEVKGTIHIESSGGGRTLEITNDFTGRWIAPVCAGIK